MSGDYSAEWDRYAKGLSTSQLEEILRTGNLNGEAIGPQVRSVLEREYATREKPFAIDFESTRVERGTMLVDAVDENEAREKAKSWEYEDLEWEYFFGPSEIPIKINAVRQPTQEEMKGRRWPGY